MGPEAVGDDEPAPVDADPDAETVGDADGRVRRVVGERLGEPIVQPDSVVAIGCGWCRSSFSVSHRELYLLVPAPGGFSRRPGHFMVYVGLDGWTACTAIGLIVANNASGGRVQCWRTTGGSSVPCSSAARICANCPRRSRQLLLIISCIVGRSKPGPCSGKACRKAQSLK